MEVFRKAMYWIRRVFAPRPVHIRLRGYYVPVEHGTDGRKTYLGWPEYMDCHKPKEEGL